MPFLDANALIDDAEGMSFIAQAIGGPDVVAGPRTRAFAFDLSAGSETIPAPSPGNAVLELAGADAV